MRDDAHLYIDRLHVIAADRIADVFIVIVDDLSQILSGFKVVSFDNLALRQINVKSTMSDAEWERFFMGDDGIDGNFNSASMYIDLVNAQYGANSCSVERYPLLDNILDMFQNIQRRFG